MQHAHVPLKTWKVMVDELRTLLTQFKNLSAQELDRVDFKADGNTCCLPVIELSHLDGNTHGISMH